jgi:triphosphoribosyl-dephospho-CoA synthase
MPVMSRESPPLSIGSAATLACVWEATAAKPGNVYRGADFGDLTYVDFLTSAAIIGPLLEHSAERGIGATVLAAVEATRLATGTNTNLGMLLLMVPLAACERPITASRIEQVISRLTSHDTKHVYEAIRCARPGGLGKVPEADVHAEPPAELSLVDAMRLAADRDLVARQYVNNFQQVLQIADELSLALCAKIPAGEAIVRVFLAQLSKHPDSLIARKCGLAVAEQVSRRAAAVLSAADCAAFDAAVADFDFYLRADGHRRNPGTSADLLAAGLFVALLESHLPWPIKFYP